MNTYWPSMSTQQQIQERTRGWFESTVSPTLYTRQNTRCTNTHGCTAIVARGQLAHISYIIKTYDKLGRWMTMYFRGKNAI